MILDFAVGAGLILLGLAALWLLASISSGLFLLAVVAAFLLAAPALGRAVRTR